MEFLGAGECHDFIENGELSGGQGANHDATRAETGDAQLLEARLLGEDDETLQKERTRDTERTT